MSAAQDKEATAEFMAAQCFEGWGEKILDQLPDADEVHKRHVNLNRCLRASAVVMTYDDEGLEDLTKTDDQVEMYIELVEALNDRVKLSEEEVILMDAAAARLMVVLSRYELSIDG